ncbi:uncharacterized protein J7T54_007845 [Emericellopsis cladophorae]|uniref:Uncharacterized protein n=1 Tax=Emericellopsis cladophorae TaxID=2686198 RepID=A0A9P9Y757_9HYPO|nr:uncharacterized protein J7T54_007845 [Emericellopsis cladophorae]KAI6784752.1 hypothetical protein J7T54_007845 [Emericellopsis cladophorae]
MVPDLQAYRRRRLASGKGATNVEIPEWTMGDDDFGHENSAPPRRRRKRRSKIPQSIFVDEDASRPTNVEVTASVSGSTWPSGLPSNDAELPPDGTVMPTATSSLMDFINAPPFVTISVPSTTGSITERTSIPTFTPNADADSNGDSLSDSGIDSSTDSEDEDDGESSDSGSEDDSRPSLSPRPPHSGSSEGIRLDPPPSKSLPSGPETESTSGPNPNASAEASREAEIQHHQDTRMALIVVGCIAGVVCLGVGLWFLARYIRRRQDAGKSRGPASRRYQPPALLRRVPFLEKRYADRTWLNVDEPEKTAPPIGEKELLAYLPDKPPAVQADIRVTSATLETYAAPSTTPSHAAFGYTASNPQPPYSPTESSLSSAYGNGTFIPPTPLHPPPRRVPEADGDEMFPPPLPVVPRSRDTIYTQYSQASSVPRFRTVSMWVRHQTKRVARDPVPEQGYGLMMPDEEAPRRVVVAPQGLGYSQ